MTDVVVRGEGNAPGQGPGEPMPPVTTTERKSLRDMQEDLRRRNSGEEPTRAPASTRGQTADTPQSASSRIGEFSKRLEATQEQPTLPGEARDKPVDAKADGQVAEPEAAEGEPEKEAKPADISLDDRAALERYREWEKGDMFPKELEGKLHEITVNGMVEYKDTAELRRGYQRGSDSRRQWAEANTLREQAQAERAQVQQHFEAIRDHDTFVEMYERNGFDFQWMEGLAKRIARDVDDRIRLTRAAGLVEMQRYGTQDWNDHRVQAAMQRAEQNWARARQADALQRRLDYERQQFDGRRKEQESQANVQQLAAQYNNQLNQLRPAAFRAYGIEMNKGNIDALSRHLGNVIQQKGFNGSITRELVMEAASDLSEELGDRLNQERAGRGQPPMSPQQWAAQRQSTGQPLPPNRIAGGGGNQTQGKDQPRKSAADFERELRQRRMGG
jgi:hypothetical protein